MVDENETLATIKELGKVYYNSDFVSPRTYESLFDELNVGGKKIMDLGAGFVPQGLHYSSSGTSILIDRKAEVIPVDRSHYALTTWNMKHGEGKTKDSQVSPTSSDLFHLPFKDESLDGGISANVLNFPDIKKEGATKILAESHRVLKKGGFLVISSFGYEKQTLADDKVEYNDGITEAELVMPEDVKEIAQELGFEVKEIPLDTKRLKEAEVESILANRRYGVQNVQMVGSMGFILKKKS